jgi:hypothetical protein
VYYGYAIINKNGQPLRVVVKSEPIDDPAYLLLSQGYDQREIGILAESEVVFELPPRWASEDEREEKYNRMKGI